MIGRKRRSLPPGSPYGLALRRIGLGARLIPAQRVVPVLVGLLLAAVLLPCPLLGALLLGFLTQGAGISAELLGGRRAFGA